MRVSELIAELQKLPQDLPVVTDRGDYGDREINKVHAYDEDGWDDRGKPLAQVHIF